MSVKITIYLILTTSLMAYAGPSVQIKKSDLQSAIQIDISTSPNDVLENHWIGLRLKSLVSEPNLKNLSVAELNTLIIKNLKGRKAYNLYRGNPLKIKAVTIDKYGNFLLKNGDKEIDFFRVNGNSGAYGSIEFDDKGNLNIWNNYSCTVVILKKKKSKGDIIISAYQELEQRYKDK